MYQSSQLYLATLLRLNASSYTASLACLFVRLNYRGRRLLEFARLHRILLRNRRYNFELTLRLIVVHELLEAGFRFTR